MSRVLLAGLTGKDNDRLQKIYEAVGTPCEVVPTVDGAMERIPANPPALVVVKYDGHLEPIHGVAEVLRTSAPVTAMIAILPDPKLEVAVRVMRAGAYDCLAPTLKPFDVLAASKRAASQKGRALFVAKVERPKKRWVPVTGILISLIVAGNLFLRVFYGPPLDQISLASAHLTGLQWEDRLLWVGDWFESNILCYRVKPGVLKRFRELEATALYKMADGQPMLLCNTPSALVTIGTDLKMRSHQRMVGLPTVQTSSIPGTRPTGLVWDGKNVWTSDGDENSIYRYGEDFKVIETVKSIIPNPMGLAYDKNALWVLGGTPLRLAKLEKMAYGFVWRGPYDVKNLLIEGVTPSGMAIGFNRLWLISGGYPIMASSSLAELTRKASGWFQKESSKRAG